MIYDILIIWREGISKIVNHKGVCRAAPATSGSVKNLLNNAKEAQSQTCNGRIDDSGLGPFGCVNNHKVQPWVWWCLLYL